MNLEHTYVDGQLVVSGRMSAVSNIQEDHYFGAILKHESSGIKLSCSFYVPIKMVSALVEKTNFLGVNGSATYQITLNQVVVPQSQIITHDAKQFAHYSPAIYCLPIPIGLGSIKSSLELIDAFSNVQNGINQYLEYDVEALKNVIVDLERRILCNIR